MRDVEDYVGLSQLYSWDSIRWDAVEEHGQSLCQFVPQRFWVIFTFTQKVFYSFHFSASLTVRVRSHSGIQVKLVAHPVHYILQLYNKLKSTWIRYIHQYILEHLSSTAPCKYVHPSFILGSGWVLFMLHMPLTWLYLFWPTQQHVVFSNDSYFTCTTLPSQLGVLTLLYK